MSLDSRTGSGKESANEAVVEQKLRTILAEVVKDGGSSRLKPKDIDPHLDFATLGINSVDLMEFVLRIENEFRVDLLSEMLPEDLPATLNDWTRVLCVRLDGPPAGK